MQSVKPSILLVEDDDIARASLFQILDRSGYTVTSVPDGESAVALLDDQAPEAPTFDIVVTDLLLREIDGIQVLKVARNRPQPPEVILLTGYGTLSTVIEALRAGAYDYLLKPCKPHDLLSCVGRAIQRRNDTLRQADAIRSIVRGLSQLQGQIPPIEAVPAEAETLISGVANTQTSGRTLRIGLLVLDIYAHTVTFNDEAIQLTPTEFALLRCLAEAQGQMRSYREIVRTTHDLDINETEAQQLLKAHIHNLRQKIDSSYIVNVRGLGYRLMAPDSV